MNFVPLTFCDLVSTETPTRFQHPELPIIPNLLGQQFLVHAEDDGHEEVDGRSRESQVGSSRFIRE